MPELKIKRADDSGEYDSTLVLFGGETSYRTETISPTMYRKANNPMIEAIKVWLAGKLKITRKHIYGESWRRNRRHRGFYTPNTGFVQQPEENKPEVNEFSHTISIGDEGYVVLFNKVGTRYFLNGIMGNKSVLIAALARTIYKSCFSDDSLELDKFLIKHIQLPENVHYALENRAPYYFYLEAEDGFHSKRIECRLKVNLISDTKVAVEISDGIWGELTIRQMNVYMNTYLNKKKQGNWSNLSPAALWEKVMKRLPTESEEQLMVAFLHQNRTSKVVRERARDLMIHIQSRYPDRIKINWGSPDKLLDVSEKPTIMYINGKVADWKLTDRGLKSQGQQNVSTYVWVEKEGIEKGTWSGPICVDNLDNKSPTGDQFVTRALGLLNDDLLIQRVSTIKGRLNSGHKVGQTDQRISLFQKE
ncbi:MAG: hypothetical protein GOVbin556_26 [Prokaryotic dsDNA virus sp.]|nr:MAG: hypothetical protein GOVbin556_26 [Prokaryotic dsDNA virus sp.]